MTHSRESLRSIKAGMNTSDGSDNDVDRPFMRRNCCRRGNATFGQRFTDVGQHRWPVFGLMVIILYVNTGQQKNDLSNHRKTPN